MSYLITLPGLGGSGEAHWQTLWERGNPAFRRFAPSDWDRPDFADWARALDRAVSHAPPRPILVAHSLSCLLVAHWSKRSAVPIAGAFLVAAPDPMGSNFPPEGASFANLPDDRLPFPALMIASSDDPYGTVAGARRRAQLWGAEFLDIGAAGHINTASGHGPWPEGRALLEAFCAGAARPG